MPRLPRMQLYACTSRMQLLRLRARSRMLVRLCMQLCVVPADAHAGMKGRDGGLEGGE
jgi:hypothetical protein